MLLPTSKLTLKTEISDQEGRLNKLVCSVSMQAEWRNFCLEKACVEDERGGPICIYYVHEQRVGWIEPLLPNWDMQWLTLWMSWTCLLRSFRFKTLFDLAKKYFS